MKTDSTGTPYPNFVFNHAVHEARGEHLLFLRLGFYPSFFPEQVVEEIDAVRVEFGIVGMVLYEVFGIHDVLMRVWMPAGKKLDQFRGRLVDQLSPLWLKTLDVFVVDNPVRHWLFPRGLAEPDAVSSLTDSDVTALEENRISSTRLNYFLEEEVLAPLAKAEPDEKASPAPPIKFAVVVVGQPQLDVVRLRTFQTTVTTVLDGAKDLTQCSLYSGFGLGHFLVLGAVEPMNFYAIDETLITGLNDHHIQEAYESRTYTYISGVRRYLLIREGLTQNELNHAPAPDTDPPPSDIPDPQRFKKLDELGRGGFSPVYRVHDVKGQRELAMKVFDPRHASYAEREFRALLKFAKEPQIVEVIDYHEEASTGRAYLLMEFIEGAALDRALAAGTKFTDLEAIAVVDGILQALEVIHPDQTQIDELEHGGQISPNEYDLARELQERALVHRDIKPGNVVLLPDASVKLIDFNIASPPGALVETASGTPRYLAPDATNDVWDISVDLFATGVILYELLTGGEHPYPNGEPRANVLPTDPRVYRTDLSSSAAAFLVKSCMPFRAQRYSSAKEMRAALSVVASDLGSS